MPDLGYIEQNELKWYWNRNDGIDLTRKINCLAELGYSALSEFRWTCELYP